MRDQFEAIENKPIFILDTNFGLSELKNISLFDKVGRDKVYILTNKKIGDISKKESTLFKGVSIERANTTKGLLSIKEILKIISRMGVNRLLVEGGARVWTSFINTNLFDEIIMFTGNKIINDSAISCFNDILPIDTQLRNFPNLSLKSILKWKDNFEVKWTANS